MRASEEPLAYLRCRKDTGVFPEVTSLLLLWTEQTEGCTQALGAPRSSQGATPGSVRRQTNGGVAPVRAF